jgi:hypothetical protein
MPEGMTVFYIIIITARWIGVKNPRRSPARPRYLFGSEYLMKLVALDKTIAIKISRMFFNITDCPSAQQPAERDMGKDVILK